MELLESIKPKSIDDVVGNKLQIQNFQNILKDKNHDPKIIVLMGPIGCGKSIICSLLFEKLNMKVHDVSTKETLTNANRILMNRSIDSFDGNNRRRVLFLDNVEILLNTERSTFALIEGCIPNLVKTKTFLVITSKLSEEKTITTALKKNIEIIKLGFPATRDVFIYLSEKLPNENEEQLLSIVKKQRGNIRDIIMNLHQSSDQIDAIVKHRGFNEYNNFEIVESFLQNHNWDAVQSILNTDPSMVSYILYENVLDEIYNNRDATIVMSSYYNINRYYVEANRMEKFMQDTQDWGVYNTIQILKIGGIYVAIKSIKKKATRKVVPFRFSQVLSKLSHKNMMAKKMTSSYIPNEDLIDLIDSGALHGQSDLKQVESTYMKYFTS